MPRGGRKVPSVLRCGVSEQQAGADGGPGSALRRQREDARTCSDKEPVMSGLHGLFPSVWVMSMPASFFLAGVTILHPIKTGC